MGHIIEEVARERGHNIVCTIDVGEEGKFASTEFASADVAIEFSIPTAAVGNIAASLAAGIPVVCGTTGWHDRLDEVKSLVAQHGKAAMYATNFSVGVNLFWAVNRYTTRLMSRFAQYRPQVTETHHIHKLDHPSGTAITTAEQMIAADGRLTRWEESEIPLAEDVLNVRYRREGEVPGIHTVSWRSAEDTIELTHTAHSRRGFALGAVLSAEWLAGRPAALYAISDMFNEIIPEQ